MQNSTKWSNLDLLEFSVFDYAMFLGVLAISTAIGVYFGFWKKQNTTNDYLLGGKSMSVTPIAFSLVASYTSAVTILGMPAEIYTYGAQYLMSCLAAFMCSIVIAKIFLPVFYELQLTSSFEYLSMRFDERIRKMASFLALFGYFVNTPITMFAPALAFSLVSGINMYYIIPIMCGICIFYTTVGGLKAVVWTDTIQFFIMNGCIGAILVLGIPNEGGMAEIWKVARETNRTDLINLDPSLYSRMTLWSVSLGMGVTWISCLGVNQASIQRFLSLPSMSSAIKVLYIYCAVVAVFKALCLLSGFIMFARYSDCDPYLAGFIKSYDQILPYYVLDTAKNLRGLPGIFVAGIFSASMSTMSTYLNTSCGMVYKDFLVDYLSIDVQKKYGNLIMKLIVIIMGTCCSLMVFVMEKFGSIIEMSIRFDGIVSGALLGTFSLGMLFPRANSKSLICGAVFSMVSMLWILYNAKKATNEGHIHYEKKSFSVEGCGITFNSTSINTMTPTNETSSLDDPFFLYKISFSWYSLMGLLSMLLITVPMSYLTEPPTKEQTKLEYFAPFLRNYINRNRRNAEEITVDKCEQSLMKNDKNI